VDMADRLAGGWAGVEHDAVAVGNALGDRHLMRMGDEIGQQISFSGGEFGHIRVMCARNHKYVNRCLRVDIAESHCSLISRDDGRGYFSGSYTAEQAIGHGLILTCGTSSAPLSYMVAVLRSRGAPPLWCHGLASFWPPSLRDESRAGAGAKAWSGCGGKCGC
jgi:hypothetical protein